MAAPSRVAFITGAAQGLGAETARRLVRDGLAVAVADVRLDAAAALAEELRENGHAIAVSLDVTSDASVDHGVARAVEELGRLDVLVNNAGVISRSPAEYTSTDDWLWEIDVNLGGAMRCSRSALPFLRQGENPAIINMGSVGSNLGLPLRLAYSAAKSGIGGLTRTLAAEWGCHGIRVNAIAPGYIDTSLMRSGFTQGVLDPELILQRTPLGRLGSPHEIASVASFLASSDAAFITGVTLPVDGGLIIDGDFRPLDGRG
jgi:3-oxoacyl-[acyl-carrier protein] reductase